MANPLSIPYQDDWVDGERRLTRPARDFLTEISQGVSLAPSRVQSVNLPVSSTTPLDASLPTTAIPLPTVFAGLYRLSYYARVTTAASVTFTIDVTFSWTDGGVPCSRTTGVGSPMGTQISGNTTSTTGTGTIVFRSDAVAPINYSTTVVNTTGGAYSLSVVLESVQTSGAS